MHIYLRTAIEDQVPEREVSIPVHSVEHDLAGRSISFLHADLRDQRGAVAFDPKDDTYSYQGVKYDFCMVYNDETALRNALANVIQIYRMDLAEACKHEPARSDIAQIERQFGLFSGH